MAVIFDKKGYKVVGVDLSPGNLHYITDSYRIQGIASN